MRHFFPSASRGGSGHRNLALHLVTAYLIPINNIYELGSALVHEVWDKVPFGPAADFDLALPTTGTKGTGDPGTHGGERERSAPPDLLAARRTFQVDPEHLWDEYKNIFNLF